MYNLIHEWSQNCHNSWHNHNNCSALYGFFDLLLFFKIAFVCIWLSKTVLISVLQTTHLFLCIVCNVRMHDYILVVTYVIIFIIVCNNRTRSKVSKKCNTKQFGNSTVSRIEQFKWGTVHDKLKFCIHIVSTIMAQGFISFKQLLHTSQWLYKTSTVYLSITLSDVS